MAHGLNLLPDYLGDDLAVPRSACVNVTCDVGNGSTGYGRELFSRMPVGGSAR